jgi:hypothetical protein
LHFDPHLERAIKLMKCGPMHKTHWRVSVAAKEGLA